MQVLITAESLAPIGGVEVQSLQVSQELVRRGHRVKVLFIEDGELRPEYETIGSVSQVSTFSFSRKRAIRDLVKLAPAIRSIAKAGPDVVYLQRAKEIVVGFAGGRLSRAPVVVHLHGFRTHRGAIFADRFDVQYIAVSHFIRDVWVRAGLNPDQVSVVHNGVDGAHYPFGGLSERARARTVLGLPVDGFVALYYGRLDAEKGVEVLIDAWHQTGLTPKDGHLLIVGSPVLEAEGERYAKNLQKTFPTGCHWLPMQRDVITPLHAADVVVVPSTYDEPFGRAVLEAMVTGRPVLASRVGGIPEILAGGFEDLLFDRGDSQGLAAKLETLADWRHSDPDLASRVSEHVREHFPASKMYDAIERVLCTAAGHR